MFQQLILTKKQYVNIIIFYIVQEKNYNVYELDYSNYNVEKAKL